MIYSTKKRKIISMNPQPNAASMLPPQAVASLVRSGGTPGQLFQQNPLAENMTPGAAGYDPTLAQQPAPGSQAQNPMQPPMPDPQQGMAQPTVGQPGQDPQQLSEAQMILNALTDRLAHHSKITEKTVATLGKMIEANGSIQDNSAAANSLSYQMH